MDKIKVGIAGAAGYTGCELIRLLATHPQAEISWLMTGKTNEGKRLHEVFPHLRGVPERVFQPLEPDIRGGTPTWSSCARRTVWPSRLYRNSSRPAARSST